VNELVNEFKILSRRHIEQIIAASVDLRHPPQALLVKQIVAHINAEDIVLVEETLNFTVDATRTCRVFACLNLPLGVIEDEAGRGDRTTGNTSNAWWKEIVLSSILPYRKLNSFQVLTGAYGLGSAQGDRVSPLQALAASGVRLEPGLNSSVRVAPSAIAAEAGRSSVPLVLGVVTADGAMELTLCRFQGERRVEVVKQILLPDFVAISGLYGLEDNHSNECMICCDERINAVLLPCCHCALCENCAPNLRDGRCPICRVPYTGYVTLPFRTEGNIGVLSPLLQSAR
jgi:hypothetical protein